jgi:hypothetical protein
MGGAREQRATHNQGRFMQSIRSISARLAAGIAAAISCALFVAAPAHATSVLPLYLDEVIDQSTTAFQGTVTDNHSGRDPVTHDIVTYTTFTVSDVLKGSVPATYTIKQIGGAVPAEKLEFRVPGVPKFAVGREYIVFMAGVSAEGFSSPIGLAQGRYAVRQDAKGKHVGNGGDFRDSASRMGAQMPSQSKALIAAQGGPVREMDVDAFKQMVRNHLGAKQ